ncbi:hypothetical protein RKD32_000465 [Streptomyces sp. SAI-195]
MTAPEPTILATSGGHRRRRLPDVDPGRRPATGRRGDRDNTPAPQLR